MGSNELKLDITSSAIRRNCLMLKLKVEHICFVSDKVYLEDSDEVL